MIIDILLWIICIFILIVALELGIFIYADLTSFLIWLVFGFSHCILCIKHWNLHGMNSAPMVYLWLAFGVLQLFQSGRCLIKYLKINKVSTK